MSRSFFGRQTTDGGTGHFRPKAINVRSIVVRAMEAPIPSVHPSRGLTHLTNCAAAAPAAAVAAGLIQRRKCRAGTTRCRGLHSDASLPRPLDSAPPSGAASAPADGCSPEEWVATSISASLSLSPHSDMSVYRSWCDSSQGGVHFSKFSLIFCFYVCLSSLCCAFARVFTSSTRASRVRAFFRREIR